MAMGPNFLTQPIKSLTQPNPTHDAHQKIQPNPTQRSQLIHIKIFLIYHQLRCHTDYYDINYQHNEVHSSQVLWLPPWKQKAESECQLCVPQKKNLARTVPNWQRYKVHVGQFPNPTQLTKSGKKSIQPNSTHWSTQPTAMSGSVWGSSDLVLKVTAVRANTSK